MMKIGFLLGSPAISGGTYVIFEHATRLQQLGHDVTIITERSVTGEEYAWHSTAHQLRWLHGEQAEEETFDILLATWWQSPFLLKNFAADHYVYFVQSIETRFFETPDPKDYGAQDHVIWQQLCEKTYSFALPMITEATWIQQYLLENYNNFPYLVRNGIRKDIYTATGPAISDPLAGGGLRVLVEGPVDVPYKNVPTSVKLARQAGADEVWLLTSSDISEYPGVDRVFSRVPIHETPPIYRSCDVLLKLSYVEGMFGPPLEMFHCGGTAIVYKVTGYDEYIVDDQNSFAVDRDDEQGVVDYLQQLRKEPDILARLKRGAQQTAQGWPDWDACARQFEKALQTIGQGRPTSRKYLARYTKELLDSSKPMVKARVLNTFMEREEKYTKNEPVPLQNFIEFYWHSDEKFTSRDFKWNHYQSGERRKITFDVEVTGFPFWIRIDPSVRIGIVHLEMIRIVNDSQQKEIRLFQDPDEFAVLFLCGTVCWLEGLPKNIFLSYGGDPMLVLPAVDETKASLGDTLTVEVLLKEVGLQQFFKEERELLPTRLPSPQAEPPAPLSWKRRILRKLGLS